MARLEPSFNHLQYSRNCKRSQQCSACWPAAAQGHVRLQGPSAPRSCLVLPLLCFLSEGLPVALSDVLSARAVFCSLSSPSDSSPPCPHGFRLLCQVFLVWRGSALWQRDTLLSWRRARAVGPEMEHDLLLTTCRCCRLLGSRGERWGWGVVCMFQTPFICSALHSVDRLFGSCGFNESGNGPQSDRALIIICIFILL